MIQINDYDVPIQVAEKIIGGTRNVPTSMSNKVVYKTFTGEELGETMSINMFNLEEIKEIAGYLTVYYKTHQNEDYNKKRGQE